MTQNNETRMTSNIFSLALEDFDETLFTGVFKLIYADELSKNPRIYVLFDGFHSQEFQINPLLNNQLIIPNNSICIVKFHHDYKTENRLLIIDKIDIFYSNKSQINQNQQIKNKPIQENLPAKEEIIKTNKVEKNDLELIDNLLLKRENIEKTLTIDKIVINDLQLDLKNFVFKSQIIEKSNLKKYSKGTDSFFEIYAKDNSGEVRIVFWKDTSEKFYDFLKLDQFYNFSNFLVKQESKFNKSVLHFELYALPESTIHEINLASDINLSAKKEPETGLVLQKEITLNSIIVQDEFDFLENLDKAKKLNQTQIKDVLNNTDGILVEIKGLVKTKQIEFSKAQKSDFSAWSIIVEIEDPTGEITIELPLKNIDADKLEVGSTYHFGNLTTQTFETKRILVFKNNFSYMSKIPTVDYGKNRPLLVF